MIVVLDEAVFEDTARSLDLLAVLQLGEEGRHRIQTDPVYEPGAPGRINEWLARQSRELRELAELVLEQGSRADAGMPLDIEIRVEAIATPRWQERPPRLPLQDALAFLRRPLVLMVENKRNDGAFLRRVALGRWRDALEHALAQGWIQIDHGGGIGEMKRAVEMLSEERAGERLRIWLMFDSDAREPGTPSSQSEELRALCASRGVAHHQLERRSMENYLPVPALFRSADRLTGPAKKQRRKATEALKAMPAAQRHCYNMKGGFRQDRGKDGLTPVPAHFGAHAAHRDLQDGFGSEIGTLFADGAIPFEERWFMKDEQTRETRAMIQALLRRL